MTDLMIETLKKLAATKTTAERAAVECPECEYVADYFDGDVDDAYMSGEYDGKIELARTVLQSMNIKY